MFNEPDLFWKNFRLGTELSISGTFIYNGLYVLENMESFYYVGECFEFLYQVSVGIERLLKVVLILAEHDEKKSQDEYEKDLITHSHMELAKRLKKKKKSLDFGKAQNKFLTLLTEFYISARYDRYSLSSVYHPDQDKQKLIEFISAEMKMEITSDMMMPTPVSDKIRRFLGKVISKIALPLYEILKTEANRLQIYTYEIATQSKSFKIFIAKEFDFYKERLMQREVALFLMNSMPEGGFKNFIKATDPIVFEQLSTSQYFQGMLNIHKSREVLDEMEHVYEEQEIHPSRMDTVANMDIGDWSQLDSNYDEEPF